jgi:Zn-finger nucleic acid-binding protein
MDCPRCRIGLHEGEAEQLTLHACGRCGGVWLAPHDADRLLSWVAVQPWREPVDVACAQCNAPMQGRFLPEPNVVVDSCPGHGVWFDHRELEMLAGVVAKKRGRPAPAMPHPTSAGPALAGVVAASAVTAFVIASADAPPPEESNGYATDVALETLIVAPEVAVVGLEVTAIAAEAGGGAIEAVAEGGAGFFGAIAEFVSGILS